MAWFLNHYTCGRCKKGWTDAWSCMCNDDCPYCGARHMSPDESDDLTIIVEKDTEQFVVFWSPATAEHDPDYWELGSFSNRHHAESFARLIGALDRIDIVSF